jgi:hypothetical protein
MRVQQKKFIHIYSHIFPNINFNVRLQKQISVEYSDISLFPNSKSTTIKQHQTAAHDKTSETISKLNSYSDLLNRHTTKLLTSKYKPWLYILTANVTNYKTIMF